MPGRLSAGEARPWHWQPCPGGPPAGFVSRPFWLFWFVEKISVAGRWMMEIAGGWLVARLADSAAQVASLISIASIPVLVSMAWAGQVADRATTSGGRSC
ncbi:MFS transporter [Myxococcus xanthus]|uniref:MFS transporter n=1 Tax=Myxococcus xanthus TaxID=34 RepID=UPI0020A2E165|nr:MFS transporter [Myxococcus xanthus]